MYRTVLINWCLITYVCIRRYLFDTDMEKVQSVICAHCSAVYESRLLKCRKEISPYSRQL